MNKKNYNIKINISNSQIELNSDNFLKNGQGRNRYVKQLF